ncbi:hypothetical protein SAMN05421825_0018 [Epilithonimonas hungarica]|uniref:Uncharacterized protein n=1 Tax=Epilithonimonas hungarica TaxID=454006 RepID=A0A1G7F8Y3_9FLAO|nr:hypothetical protein SAMN05421825_0018 [Epilithonimonas hungarica]
MKNFLLILLVIFSNDAFSQEIDSHEQFLTSVKEYKRVIQYNSTGLFRGN